MKSFKHIAIVLLLTLLLGCDNSTKVNERIELLPEPDKELREENEKLMAMYKAEMETLAFEGLQVDFKFKKDPPTFGDVFLITGLAHSNFPANSEEFANLSELGFTQVDDYFGIRNTSEIGDDVLVWLYPLVNGEVVFHNQGPFDAIRLQYVVIRNEKKHVALIEEIYTAFTTHLEVDVYFEGERINDVTVVKNKLTEVINFYETELKVSPGSEQALQLEL